MDLAGSINLFREPGDRDYQLVPLTIIIDTNDAENYFTEQVGTGVQIFDRAGISIARIDSYRLSRSVDGRYEIHSGAFSSNDGEADIFAISDFVETALGAAILAGCLAIHATQIWIIKTAMDDYRSQGQLPEIKMHSGLLSAMTCRFEFEINVFNPEGKLVHSEKKRVGRKAK